LDRALTVLALVSRRTTSSISSRLTVRLLSVRGAAPVARTAAIWQIAPMVPEDPTATSKPSRSISRTAGASVARMSRRQRSTASPVSLFLAK
jgi:hypothetical protein